MNRDVLGKIFADRPDLHSGETETSRLIQREDTIFRGSALDRVNRCLPAFYAIRLDVANYIYESVSEFGRTLETGAGFSTLAFALRGSEHTTITPNVDEVTKIKEYAHKYHISLERVEFVVAASEDYLPQCGIRDLDFVLIDGKHAFPWPMLDWFYLADKLKMGGILLLDDVRLASVAILRDFLSEDRRWQREKSFQRQAVAFTKVAQSVHDVAWHMQPYVTNRYWATRLLDGAKRVARKSGIPHLLGWR